jgi:glycosyltransferase involved in cell wall biosynthesis
MTLPAPGRKLLFLRRGLFSYSNVSTAEQLAKHFPEYPIENVDVGPRFDYGRACLLRNPIYFLRNLVEARRLYSPLIRSGKLELRNAFSRTIGYMKAVRAHLVRRFSGRTAEFAFTFQTQSLFDAHLPGLVHFLFTDHTHLANLGYPSFDRDLLAGADWIAEERAIYHAATKVFTMAEHVEKSVVADYGVPAERVATVHAGSNMKSRPLPLENDGFRNQTIVFIGIDWERKGGPTLLRAFEKVREELPAAKLIVVGCDPGISQSGVQFTGKIPREEVARYHAKASVLCLPSRIEPFGIAPIEAALGGVPSVVSDVGALPGIIVDGKTGRVVPVDDADLLAKALSSLLRDPGLCQRLGEAGRKHVTERFNWDHVGARLREHILTIFQ